MKKTFMICLVVFTVLLAGCGTQGTQTTDDTITFGSILMLTGAGANWGNSTKNGIELAVEDINDSGGILGKQLRFEHEDDKSDPKSAISAYQKHKNNNIDFIIGTTWSTTGLPLKDIAHEDKTIMISASLGLAEFNESSKFLFNTWPHDAILSAALAEIVYENGHRDVALFGAQEVWIKDQTRIFKEKFESLGGTVSYVFEPKIEERDVSTDVLKVKADPDVDVLVYTNTLYNLGIQTVQRVKEFGIDLPAYSLSLDDDIIKASDGAYNGMTFLTSLTPTEEFRTRYTKRFGDSLNVGADSGYDAVMMLAEAIEKTESTDTKTVQQYLNPIVEYQEI